MDFRSYDWDDTELIRAYNRGLEARKASEKKDNKKEKRRKWNIGDHCRAIYSVDQEYYEAKVVTLNGDFCTVEFLGYDDTEDVDFAQLKESEGKKARKKQIKAAKGDDASFNESESAMETSDVSVASHSSFRKKKKHVKQTAKNTTFDTTTYEASFHQQYPVAAPAPAPAPYYTAPAPMPASLPFMPVAPQYQVPAAPPVPQYPMSAAPPMPQCPGLANNPSLASMLSAWYMAGYYTGLYSEPKGNSGCPKCCGRSNHCCRN